jgi:hypothetical protein
MLLARKRHWTAAVHVGIVTAHSRHEGSIWGIVKILGLLAHTVHTTVPKVALDASQTWSLVAWAKVRRFATRRYMAG